MFILYAVKHPIGIAGLGITTQVAVSRLQTNHKLVPHMTDRLRTDHGASAHHRAAWVSEPPGRSPDARVPDTPPYRRHSHGAHARGHARRIIHWHSEERPPVGFLARIVR